MARIRKPTSSSKVAAVPPGDAGEETFDDLTDAEIAELDARHAELKAGRSVDAFTFLDALAKKQ